MAGTISADNEIKQRFRASQHFCGECSAAVSEATFEFNHESIYSEHYRFRFDLA